MILDSKLQAVFLIYFKDGVFQNKEIYHLFAWIFQERYFVISKKHQELLYKKMAVINEVREMIYSVVNIDDMFSILGDIILKYAKSEMGFLILLDENESYVVRASWHRRNAQIKPDEYLSDFERDYPDNLLGIVLEDKGRLIDVVAKEKRLLKLDSVKIVKSNSSEEIDVIIPEMLFIPLVNREKIIGYLSVSRMNFLKEKFSDNDISIIETIVSLAASSIENNRLYKQILKEEVTSRELQVAQSIQVGLQANFNPQLRNFDLAAASLPARVIGGDYYDFFILKDDLLGVTLTDIVGKGIPAALIMAFFKGVMQSSVFSGNGTDVIFNEISQKIFVNKSVKNYIPSVYAEINDGLNTITYTNAGHENPLYFSCERQEFKALEEGGLPLGAFEDYAYDKNELLMLPGDIVVMFTDGVTEARNLVGASFGDENLKDLILRFQSMNSQQLLDKISEEVLAFSLGTDMHDDMTIIVIKRI